MKMAAIPANRSHRADNIVAHIQYDVVLCAERRIISSRLTDVRESYKARNESFVIPLISYCLPTPPFVEAS